MHFILQDTHSFTSKSQDFTFNNVLHMTLNLYPVAEMKQKSEGGTRLMMTPSNYSPEDSLADDLPSDDDEIPRLKLLATDETSSSRSPSP